MYNVLLFLFHLKIINTMANVFVLSLCIVSLVNTQKTKRLLLNDPDVIGSRLSNLEKSIQEMKAEFGQEKAQMQATISQLQTALTHVTKGKHYTYKMLYITHFFTMKGLSKFGFISCI